MIKGYENKAIRLNASIAGHKKGDVVKIKCEKFIRKIPVPKKKESDEQKYKEIEKFIPTDKYWRDRFKDSKIDGCVEFVKEGTTKKK